MLWMSVSADTSVSSVSHTGWKYTARFAVISQSPDGDFNELELTIRYS